MIPLTKTLVRRWMESLLHIHDSPKRTAAAFAVGVFWGFSPYFGLHTVMGLICAFVFRLNRVAVIVGVYANLPWFLLPYYTLATIGGATLLGVKLPPDFGTRLHQAFELSVLSGGFWSELLRVMEPLLWPYHIGSLLGGVILAVLAYVVALPAIVAGRKHLHLRHHVNGSPEGH